MAVTGRAYAGSLFFTPKTSSCDKQKSVEDEGWVYARLAHLTYHNTKRSLDFARRRRWQRRLKRVSEDATNLPVFHFGYKKVGEGIKA